MRRRDVLEGKVAVQARKVEPARHGGIRQECSELGPEDERVGTGVIVERFFPHAVPGEEERALPGIPYGEREHPVEVGDAVFPVCLVGVDNDLGIRLRAKDVALVTEPVA